MSYFLVFSLVLFVCSESISLLSNKGVINGKANNDKEAL